MPRFLDSLSEWAEKCNLGTASTRITVLVPGSDRAFIYQSPPKEMGTDCAKKRSFFDSSEQFCHSDDFMTQHGQSSYSSTGNGRTAGLTSFTVKSPYTARYFPVLVSL